MFYSCTGCIRNICNNSVCLGLLRIWAVYPKISMTNIVLIVLEIDMGTYLKNKVAIITGSGRGIGRAEALAFAAEGARVVVNDVGVESDGSGGSKSPADEVVSEIRALGGEAVANYDSVAELSLIHISEPTRPY